MCSINPVPGGVNGSDRVAYSGFSTHGGALAPFLTGDKGQLGQGVDVKSWGASSDLKIGFQSGTLSIISGFRGLHQALAVDFPDSGLGPTAPYDLYPTGQFALGQELTGYQYSQEVKWSGDRRVAVQIHDRRVCDVETNRDSYGASGELWTLCPRELFSRRVGR